MIPNKSIQIRIIQVSDVHFGEHYISSPLHSDYSTKGFPSIAKLVADDLNSPYWNIHPWASGKLESAVVPMIIAATGDFTQKADKGEFDRASQFLEELSQSTIQDDVVGLENTYMVPGNHDVTFHESDPAKRFESYCTFYNKVYSAVQSKNGRPIARPHEIEKLTLIHKVGKAKVIVAEINCCHYVEKDTIDQSRGQVDQSSISELRRQLEALTGEEKCWLKIAILHHHPILIPNFVEPGRNVDAIANAKSLLRLLREHGFHAILHGHKHYPHVFTYDPEPAWAQASSPAQLVVAGGSLGSRQLPTGNRSTNTYNVMTIKWDPSSRLARAVVVTRGLKRLSYDGELDPDQWTWETLRTYDRILSSFEHLPSPRAAVSSSFPKPDDEIEHKRADKYKVQRGNMPVVEVIPSVLPGQGYEARVWLVQHEKPGSPKAAIPRQVTWSAGRWFKRKTVGRTGAPHFCTSFNYWGSTLIQAIIEFDDGEKVAAYVYARVPQLSDDLKGS